MVENLGSRAIEETGSFDVSSGAAGCDVDSQKAKYWMIYLVGIAVKEKYR